MRALPLFILALLGAPAHAQSLGDAFSEGTTMGQTGKAAARGQINTGTAQSIVPGYNASPPQASYFGNASLTAPASAVTRACAIAPVGPGAFADQACNAVNYSQTNPVVRQTFNITGGDPLLTGGRTITNDPQSIAGNIAGNYSACTVLTTTTPDRYETLTCHQYRTTEDLTCDKVLSVTQTLAPGCAPGQFLTRVTANFCPNCVGDLVFEFTCGTGNYLMHVYRIEVGTGGVLADLGTEAVAGALDTQVGMTPGPSRIDADFCYQTFYDQSCAGDSCSIGAWIYDPCQGTSNFGTSTFVMPTVPSFVDTWNNQCATLEARAR